MRRLLPNFKRAFALACVSTIFTAAAYSQSLVDGFMKGKGNGSLVVSYSWEQYDEFYFADTKMDAPPPYGGQITTQSIGLYGIYGLADELDVVLNIPYVNAQGDGNEAVTDQSVGGLQDAELMLKWRPLVFENESGTLGFLAAAGIATPFSDYAADSVLSIGNGATRFDGRLITHYLASTGLFAELQAGYSIRGDEVPNATLLSAKVGFAAANFYVDLWSATQISDSDAPDIGQAPFSQTRVNYTQIGITGYYPFSSALGVSVGVAQYVSGRNIGIATRLSGGLIYSF